jgi:hypothetical protein
VPYPPSFILSLRYSTRATNTRIGASAARARTWAQPLSSRLCRELLLALDIDPMALRRTLLRALAMASSVRGLP